MIRIECHQALDELGEPEELTFDLFPLVSDELTVHLDENGLPKIGTKILPGMILVGKIGKSKKYDPSREPSCLDLHARSIEMRAEIGEMWIDRSLYATAETAGQVVSAHLEKGLNGVTAVIEINRSEG